MREQAKAYLQKPEDHMQGLNLINSTNLDYFQPQHQAEMVNLKAQFFAALGDGDAGMRGGAGACSSSVGTCACVCGQAGGRAGFNAASHFAIPLLCLKPPKQAT